MQWKKADKQEPWSGVLPDIPQLDGGYRHATDNRHEIYRSFLRLSGYDQIKRIYGMRTWESLGIPKPNVPQISITGRFLDHAWVYRNSKNDERLIVAHDYYLDEKMLGDLEALAKYQSIYWVAGNSADSWYSPNNTNPVYVATKEVLERLVIAGAIRPKRFYEDFTFNYTDTYKIKPTYEVF